MTHRLHNRRYLSAMLLLVPVYGMLVGTALGGGSIGARSEGKVPTPSASSSQEAERSWSLPSATPPSPEDQQALHRIIEDARQRLKAAPDDVPIRFALAYALQQSGQPTEAIREYYSILTRQPTHLRTHNNLGILLAQEGSHYDAVMHFSQVLAKEPRNTAARLNAGLTFKKSKDLDEAIRQFEKVLELDPTHVGAYVSLGTVYYDQGKLDRAIQQYRTALSLDARHAVAYRNLAMALLKKGAADEAIAIYRTAVDLLPNDPLMRFDYATALDIMGDRDEAARQLRVLLHLPSDTRSYAQLRERAEAELPDAAPDRTR